ncbi:hypothetical protein NIA71_06575 [Ihubacter massiliensis]|uniref:Uncharacterized protein n=1 Tax=Hominibacterium faecale TaxID=2839743 RepID=A0A9J6QRC6_9FIRM|nr:MULTISPECIES: hypothetical protein [Eubacteriales Family XIII. Incertae Sedis]MCI7300951.1 hypothetical protein [Clostridia bacterium]MDE8734400.1 hypothetical protein [Eubacteriales bacterium DFI.9.88]MDY3010098.1 hypothetical protein [Clostridiales Family XIII bacterium]MCO7121613.1 hypothetical protein [Ihubacter massiliensis]MCU7378594.1 hypothetical protein [Hominibacterium faecale]
MKGYDDVYAELKGRTGTAPEIEQELCRRIAEIETTGSVVPELTKMDWVITWILIAVGTVLPIAYYAIKLGVYM